MSTKAQFYARAGIATALAALGGTAAALTDGAVSIAEGITIATVTLTAAGAWLGLTAGTGVDDSVGRGVGK